MKVLRPEDLEMLLEFEEEALRVAEPDEMEREFKRWHARWRREALEHYLSLGWCFGVFDQKNLRGYFLAQPFLFFRGMTQTLWIEHLHGRDPAATSALVELAYRCARDKHMQKVVFHDAKEITGALGAWKPSPVGEIDFEIKTAKF